MVPRGRGGDQSVEVVKPIPQEPWYDRGGQTGHGAPVSDRETLWSIQYLRAYAAIAVVMYHVAAFRLMPADWGAMRGGERGVDIFFVISGVIMFSAARHESFAEFWRRRILRIVPLYWLCTGAMLVALWTTLEIRPSGSELLSSLLFVPRFSDASPDKIWPVLYPGWTLQYEMFFYFLFSLGLVIRRPLLLPVAAVASMVLVGAVYHVRSAPMMTYTNPLMLEFAAGLTIAYAWRSRLVAPTFERLRWVIWPAMAALWWPDLPRTAVTACACLIVIGALGYERRRGVSRVGILALLGDASYAIYLVHAPLIWMLGPEGLKLPASTPMALAVTFVAVASGVAVHRWIEKPIGRLLNRASSQMIVRMRPMSATPG
ncbi:acyltransferase family protein [uncultured Sphingomonas sp.]|uniref:acyltransferase family protein n=1 Tax=uncultured Sphingomonas sp. TaxID=158754 RepID=UPI0035CC82C6